MANAVGVAGGVQQLLAPQGPASDALLLPANFPSLHPALTFSRHEVDVLGGLHIFRYADYVDFPTGQQYLPAHATVNAQAGGVRPYVNGNVVMPDAARE